MPGGSLLPKDPFFFLRSAPEVRGEKRIPHTVASQCRRLAASLIASLRVPWCCSFRCSPLCVRPLPHCCSCCKRHAELLHAPVAPPFPLRRPSPFLLRSRRGLPTIITVLGSSMCRRCRCLRQYHCRVYIRPLPERRLVGRDGRWLQCGRRAPFDRLCVGLTGRTIISVRVLTFLLTFTHTLQSFSLLLSALQWPVLFSQRRSTTAVSSLLGY